MLALLGALPGAELLTESDRSRAFFQDPNVFGPFLIPPALILIEEIIRPRLLRRGWLTKAVLLAILLVGVLFSYSRGAWVNLGARARRARPDPLAARRRPHGCDAVAVTAVTAAVMATVVVATGSADFLAERARPQTYDTERFSGQRAGLRPAAEYPFGAGPGQFESIAAHLGPQHLRARARGGGIPGAPHAAGAAGLHADRRAPQRGGRAGDPRHRLGGAARRVVRPARQQRGHRHAPLAPPVGLRRPDLGGDGRGPADGPSGPGSRRSSRTGAESGSE